MWLNIAIYGCDIQREICSSFARIKNYVRV